MNQQEVDAARWHADEITRAHELARSSQLRIAEEERERRMTNPPDTIPGLDAAIERLRLAKTKAETLWAEVCEVTKRHEAAQREVRDARDALDKLLYEHAFKAEGDDR